MSTHQHPSPLSVSVADAVAMTGLSQYIIRDAINRGDLPAIRVGDRRIVVLTNDLLAWLNGHPKVADDAAAS